MKKKLLSALQQKPYFLVLLPVFFILHGYNDFFGFFPIKFVLLNFITTLFSAAALYFLTAALFRKKEKNALFAFWLLLIILIFGTIHDVLKKQFHAGFLSRYTFIIPFLLLLFILFFLYLKKSKSLFIRTFQFLNLLFFSLLFYETLTGIYNFVQFKKGSYLLDNRFTTLSEYKTTSLPTDSAKPDIYFLVFDAMPSTKAMKAYWNFDNSSLDSFLIKEKFFIGTESKSNYNLTVLSLGSTLNMDYTPPIDLYQDVGKLYMKAASSILKNSLTEILNKEGYAISQYQPISFINKDWKAKPFFNEWLYMNYFYKTLPGRIYRDLSWNLSRLNIKFINDYNQRKYEQTNRESETNLFKTVELVKKSCSAEKEKSEFIYAHFMLPHDPYIFDSTGRLKPADKTINLTEEDQSKAFIEQVKFADHLINELVVFIKNRNKKNTVIIIEGDHGYRNIKGKKGYMIFDNLNSIYFPDGDYNSLYPSMSPVNSFRVVVNKFFSGNLPLLKDSSIFIPYTLPGEN